MVSRLDTMARFAEPDDKEPKVMGQCENCFDDLYEGDTAILDRNNEAVMFCSSSCAVSGLTTIKTLGED